MNNDFFSEINESNIHLAIQALADNELSPDKIPELLEILHARYELRDEYSQLLRLRASLQNEDIPMPPPEWFDELEKIRPRKWLRRTGLVLLCGSLGLLTGISLTNYISSSSGLVAFAVICGGIGFFLLLLLTWRDTMHESRQDKYAKEVLR
ncbi:anti-sigma factor [Spirochaeta dissipatitropha]